MLTLEWLDLAPGYLRFWNGAPTLRKLISFSVQPPQSLQPKACPKCWTGHLIQIPLEVTYFIMGVCVFFKNRVKVLEERGFFFISIEDSTEDIVVDFREKERIR